MQRDFPLGTIQAFSGAIVDIPRTWRLCDGTLRTPDLRNKFIVGAADTFAPGDVGGAVNHNHPFTGLGHNHLIIGGTEIASGADGKNLTSTDPVIGTTDNANGLAPFYALAFIMYRGRIR